MRTICSCFGRRQLPINLKGTGGSGWQKLRRTHPISGMRTARWHGCIHLIKRNLRVPFSPAEQVCRRFRIDTKKPGKCRVFGVKDCWFGRWPGYALLLDLVAACAFSSGPLRFRRDHSETLGVAMREALRKTLFQFYVFAVCVH